MEYQYIVNPQTGRRVNVNSKIGRQIILAYGTELYGAGWLADLGEKAKKAAKATGSAVAKGAKATGSAVAKGAKATTTWAKETAAPTIAKGARATGSAIATGARATGSAIATGARATGSVVATGARATAAAAKRTQEKAQSWASETAAPALKRSASRTKTWAKETAAPAIAKGARATGSAVATGARATAAAAKRTQERAQASATEYKDRKVCEFVAKNAQKCGYMPKQQEAVVSNVPSGNKTRSAANQIMLQNRAAQAFAPAAGGAKVRRSMKGGVITDPKTGQKIRILPPKPPARDSSSDSSDDELEREAAWEDYRQGLGPRPKK